jgi:CheY-like chemotaxis protein
MISTHLFPLLIVDAAPATHDCLRAACREAGYGAVFAPDAAAACAALDGQRFRLIFATAAKRPWAGRWVALELLRRAAGPTPVVLLALAGATPFVGYRARGFADLLALPREANELCAMLRDYLEGQ